MTADEFDVDAAELAASYVDGPQRMMFEEPTVPVTGDLWYDIAASATKIYNGTHWIEIKT